jgi:hypothetical protein
LPDGPAGDSGSGLPDGLHQAVQRRSRRGARKVLAGTALLAGFAGLAVSALGIAHNLLPRQFTVAQRRQIMAWELDRRWRSLPADAIFPGSVSYTVPGIDLNSSSSLELRARLLSIGQTTGCEAAVTGTAAQLLSKYHCAAAMRATYLDSSGALVATLMVAVLPSTAAQHAVTEQLTGSGSISPTLVRTLRVADTAAAGFGVGQRQLTQAAGAGPYLILSTAGFADGRHRVRLSGDPYLGTEMSSLASGLVASAERVLGKPLPPLVCPGGPGC